MAARKAARFQRRLRVTNHRLFWSCVGLLVLVCCANRVQASRHRSEAEKQSAFEQLIGKGGRLRWLAQPGITSAPDDARETAVGPPTSPSLDVLIKDEPVKRHDRRHANSSTGEKKKKGHVKRHHHAGLVS